LDEKEKKAFHSGVTSHLVVLLQMQMWRKCEMMTAYNALEQEQSCSRRSTSARKITYLKVHGYLVNINYF